MHSCAYSYRLHQPSGCTNTLRPPNPPFDYVVHIPKPFTTSVDLEPLSMLFAATFAASFDPLNSKLKVYQALNFMSVRDFLWC